MSFSVKILGSNSASFAHNRHHTSQILQVQSELFMIDCGEGTQLQCKKYNVKLSKINHILISHLHGDHYYGLIGLLSTMHLYGRTQDLILIGPPGLAEIITLQLRHSETALNFRIDFREWNPNQHELVFENSRLTVHTIPLDHRVPCSGYLIKEKPKKRRINSLIVQERLPPSTLNLLKDGKDVTDDEGNLIYRNKEATLPPAPQKTYAYCSDTRLREEIIPLIQGADILYHEATFMDEMVERAHMTYHTTATEAGSLAKKADCKMLLIGHFSTRYKDLDGLLEEARSEFQMTYLATEGQVFTPRKTS